jgi:hypothetical protein
MSFYSVIFIKHNIFVNIFVNILYILLFSLYGFNDKAYVYNVQSAIEFSSAKICSYR